MADEEAFGSGTGEEAVAASGTEIPPRLGFRDRLEDQLALRGIIHE